MGTLAVESQVQPPFEIQWGTKKSFRFISYGDTRFTDTKNTTDTDPAVRREIVKAIAKARPDFLTIGGDIPMDGYKSEDWKVYDDETAVWRTSHLRVFPVLGNHELRVDPKAGLENYFARYPELQKHRFYSIRAGSALFLMLDSELDETTGDQGVWLRSKLGTIPSDVKFVFVQLHRPPLTSATDKKIGGMGSEGREPEHRLGAYLEERQKTMHAQIIVFSSHVHNYERHEHGGVTYFVSGGGAAHASAITRYPDDPFQSDKINYHYLIIRVDSKKVSVTMRRLEIVNGKDHWSKADKVTIPAK